MNNKYNSNWEGNISRIVPEVAKSVEKDLGLREINREASVVNESINFINESSGNSSQKSKVRVLTNGHNAMPMPDVEPVNNDSRYFDYSNSPFEQNNGGQYLGSGGSTQSLILLFTAILVVMVITVSLTILKYFGM